MTLPSAVVSSDLVAAALDAADAEERRQATQLIAELFLHDALPLLVRALGDSDWRVRKEATCAARAFVPAPKLVDAMVTLFEPGDNVVNIFAMGPMATEAIKASENLLARGIYANVIAVTSPDLLCGILAHENNYDYLRNELGINSDLYLNKTV